MPGLIAGLDFTRRKRTLWACQYVTGYDFDRDGKIDLAKIYPGSGPVGGKRQALAPWRGVDMKIWKSKYWQTGNKACQDKQVINQPGWFQPGSISLEPLLGLPLEYYFTRDIMFIV
jgi:hypothetical protein